MNTCFYHSNDHDGKSSGAIVKHKYPDCRLIGIDYNDPFPWNEIQPDDTVIVTDFCLEPMDRMIHLSKKCNLIWIDHHISAIKDAAEMNFNPEGLRRVGNSGCELTWEYLFHDKQIPRAIFHLGRFDVWDHSDPLTLIFQYGMLAEDTHPDNDILWEQVLSDDDDFFNRIVSQGKVIQHYQDNINAHFLNKAVFEATFCGLRALCLNNGIGGSLIFESQWDTDKYDLMIAFYHTKDKLSVSFYTDKEQVDVSRLASRFGGGGHAGAAGCSFKDYNQFFTQLK